ncbi:MAG: thioredoxin family protein [Muribaculaceae bacterium]|nr:thioredoxin family protein [Muribaculaceae bacterium]
MKKIAILAFAAAAMALGACSKAEKAADTETQTPEALIVAEETDSTETVDALYAQTDSSTEVDVVTLQKFGDVIKLDNDNLYRPDTKVDVLTVLDFNAVWCGPCKRLDPVFHAAAEKYQNVKFVSVDVDANPETAKAFGAQSIPHVVILNPAGATKSFTGTEDLLPAEKFFEIINKSL